MRYNPYRPNSIVAPGMFSGRLHEIEIIEQCLFQTKNGNPQHFLLQGERGIGKSSLMLYSKLLAEGEIGDSPASRFLVIDTELNVGSEYLDIIRKIGSELRAHLSSRQHLQTLAKSAWDFLSKWSVLGVEYKGAANAPTVDEAITELANTISALMRETGNELDGILILIDEADKPDLQNANLGEFTKLFSERLTKLGCSRVCLGLAGLPIVLSKLRQGHESSLRIFHSCMLEPLSDGESKNVIIRGLEEANEKNSDETKIQDDAVDTIVTLSQGYPHFIQQFSYSAFDQDTDCDINIYDVLYGAYQPNGALSQLGAKYFEEMYYAKITSPDYRTVLEAMAKHGDAWVSRQDIIKESEVSESQVSNALNALKQRNIIHVNPATPGEYHIPIRSFAVWINANSRVEAEAETKDITDDLKAK